MDPRARAVVSYADIVEPAFERSDAPPPSSTPTPTRPAKRPASPPRPNGSSSPTKKPRRTKFESSRTLTHEEIWDDSALVGAWDAAMEEYRTMNGPGRGWMEEPVRDSPLWYNTQPEEEVEEEYEDGEEEEYPREEPYPAAQDQAPQSALALPPIAPPIPIASAAPIPPLPQASHMPQTPQDLLNLAMQSYYMAGYYMGAYSERMRIGGPANAPAPAPDGVGEPEEDMVLSDEEAIVTQRG